MQQDSQMLAQNFGPANGGDIKIKAANLQMQEMAMIAAASLGPGNAGNITVNVDNNLTLLPITEISSNTVDTGRGGNISITAKNISISADQFSIDNDLFTGIAAQTRGAGVGGDISIRADNIQVRNAGAISTNLMPLPEEYGGPTIASGTGGNIDIVAKNIDVSGMIIQESTGVDFHSRIESRLMTEYATGTGGDVSVKADRITLGDGGYIGTYLTYGSPGKAGNITVNADTLTLNPQGKIESSSVLGTGTEASAGDITIDANRIVMVGVGERVWRKNQFHGFSKRHAGWDRGQH